MSKQKRILICEDHPIYSKGIQDFLELHFEVVGCFASGNDTVSFLEKNKCDILLLDLNLIDGNGIEVIEALQKKEIEVKIVVITMYNDKLLIEKCKNLGVHAYCSKHIVNAELLDILESLKDGVFLLDTSLKQKLNAQKRTAKAGFEKKLHLTSREKELIRMFSEGMSSKEISSKLFVSTFTVDTHKKNIYRKLNIKSIAELVSFYYENL